MIIIMIIIIIPNRGAHTNVMWPWPRAPSDPVKPKATVGLAPH